MPIQMPGLMFRRALSFRYAVGACGVNNSAEHSVFTYSDQAVEIVHRTGCHLLVLAIGKGFGAYQLKNVSGTAGFADDVIRVAA